MTDRGNRNPNLPDGTQAGSNEVEPVPLSAHIPGALLLAAIWIAWLLHLPGGMLSWGLSGAALAAGRWDTVILHMFAHAGLIHIGFNSIVLFSLAGPLMTWMGRPPGSWLRFFAFYAIAGLAGAALFVALNPTSAVPMVGASGAISGLIGLAARVSADRERLIPLLSAEMGQRIWGFAKANLWIVLLFGVLMLLSGGGGGIAWEAHLGGFLVGMLAARVVLVDAQD